MSMTAVSFVSDVLVYPVPRAYFGLYLPSIRYHYFPRLG